MNAFENWQVAIGIVQAVLVLFTALVALFIGFKQNEINDRLKSLQDYVAISAIPDQSGKIKLINTGKVNLYLWGFDIPGNNHRFTKPRMIPAGTMESAWYWIEPPILENKDKKSNFDVTLYLTDEFDTKWVSEHGGEITPITIDEKGKAIPGFQMIIWSYKTFKSEWKNK